MKEKLLKIINNYGVNHQLKHLYTEMYEFTEAVLDYEHDETGYIKTTHITEELADIYVMLEEFKNYYGLDSKKIVDMMTFKIERQLKRIEKENNER